MTSRPLAAPGSSTSTIASVGRSGPSRSMSSSALGVGRASQPSRTASTPLRVIPSPEAEPPRQGTARFGLAVSELFESGRECRKFRGSGPLRMRDSDEGYHPAACRSTSSPSSRRASASSPSACRASARSRSDSGSGGLARRAGLARRRVALHRAPPVQGLGALLGAGDRRDLRRARRRVERRHLARDDRRLRTDPGRSPGTGDRRHGGHGVSVRRSRTSTPSARSCSRRSRWWRTPRTTWFTTSPRRRCSGHIRSEGR